MNSESDKQKDKRLSKMFSAADRNLTGPDEEFLDKLREKSTAEFLTFSANDTRNSQIQTSFPIWRTIMKSNRTKFAAAAVIIIICFAGFSEQDLQSECKKS